MRGRFEYKQTHTGPNHPYWTLRLGHETVATVEGDLAVAVKVVVGGPDPGALRIRHVNTRHAYGESIGLTSK